MQSGVLRVLLAIVGASLGVGCGGSDTGPVLSGGAKVDMGGWSLFLQCQGSGSPTVVFDAGFYDSHAVWARLEPAVARRTRTCSYDRAGVGQSDPRGTRESEVPAEQVVDELHALLARADVPPPYVLVGHSLAGLHARLFVARHPQDVSGLVLVDPTSPDYFARGRTEPEHGGAAIGYQSAYASLRSVELGDRPTVVLVSWEERAITEPDARELARRSSSGLLVRTRTGHGIHSELPKLVTEAIQLVVDAVRSEDPLPPCPETQLPRLGGQCRAS
jgi:predicted alpha/beta hydrolase family esterase